MMVDVYDRRIFQQIPTRNTLELVPGIQTLHLCGWDIFQAIPERNIPESDLLGPDMG